MPRREINLGHQSAHNLENSDWLIDNPRSAENSPKTAPDQNMSQRVDVPVILLLLSLTSACGEQPPPVNTASPAPSLSTAGPQMPVDSAVLIPASAAGDIAKVRELIAAGADVNVRAVGGRTPLIEAAYAGNSEIAKLLLDAGANIGLKKDDGESALSFAQSGNHAQIVQMILGVEQLMVASGRGDQARVKQLLDQGVSVNACGFDGRTALMEAAYGGHTDIVKALLAAAANVTPRKGDGATALSLAEGGGYTEIVALLRSAGAQ